MCSSPIFIKNPYYHIGDKGLNKYHDTLSAYVRVPCGKCSQCVSLRQSYYNQRIQMESLRSELFFFTLTYANRGLCTIFIGDYNLPYPHYNDIQNLFRQLRKVLPHSIRYFVVSEYGTRRKRPHYHGIIAVDKNDIKQYYKGSNLYCEKQLYKLVFHHWRRNLSRSRKYPLYMSLSDFIYKNGRSTYDLHWIQPIMNHDNDVSFYVTKYLLKYDSYIYKLIDKITLDATLSEDETKLLISKIKPRSIMSKDFGSWKLDLVQKHINYSFSKNREIPQFIDINTGFTSLLSPYYRKHLLPMSFKEGQWKIYTEKLHNLNIYFRSMDKSYNLDVFDDSTIYDLNCMAMKKIKDDNRFLKTKRCISKKY